jgi:hypothetical protein
MKKLKLNFVFGWYKEILILYTLIWRNFLRHKYPIVNVHPGMLSYINTLVGLNDNKEAIEDYNDILTKEGTSDHWGSPPMGI